MELVANEGLKWLKNSINSAAEQAKHSENQILGTAAVLAVVLLLVSTLNKKFRKFPPGPVGLPLVGYAPFISNDIHLDFTKLGKKYGDLFSLTLGTETIIVLNGINAIREAFAKPEFLGRPPSSIFSWLSKYSPFFAQDVHVWREQRRFLVHTLKDLGLGESRLEDDIENEIRHFMDVLRSHKSAPLDVKEALSPSMSNNVCALVFGKRYEYQDPDRLLLDENLEKTSDIMSQAAVSIFFPWSRHIPGIIKLCGLTEAVAGTRNLTNFFKKEIEKHRRTFNASSIRDYIDGYLKEIESKKKDPNTSFNDDTLCAALLDVFGAGSETVRTTILWCIYTMAAYPDVQKRAQKEIRDVLGTDRRPEFQDQRRLPYTHAVILEVMRWKPVVPINILRYTTGDTIVGGHHIPKNVIAIANFWAVLHDPNLWEDPEAFKPERFLSPDGTSVVKSANFVPFSLGKRSCPGEAMAYLVVFLYFANILREFDIVFPEGFTPSFEAKLAITYRLNSFQVKLVERK